MRKQLLLSTAALLAGMILASAQGVSGGGMSGAQSSGSAGGGHQQSTQSTQSQGRSSQAQQGAQEQGKQGQSQRSEGRSQHEQTTGQNGRSEPAAGQNTQNQREQGKQAQQPARNQREQGKQAQQPARNQREQTTKQNQQPQTQGQATQRNQAQPSGRQQAQPQQGQTAQPQQGQAQRTQPQQGEAQRNQQGFAPGQIQASGAAGGHVTLSADQQARIRETALARSDVPRLNKVNFGLSVGTIVPTSVHVMAVPETLVSIYPEWRDDMYFVVRDDIIIVDHSHRIVAVLPVGSSGARAQYGSSGSQGSGMVMQLSRDEIRQVQIILNQKGFNIGEPDGVLGGRTRAALIQFQRQQGFQASGQIDQQTMGALGVSKAGVRQQGQQGQPSSTGQAGGTMNQPNANEGTAAGQPSNQGAAQPSTAGQAGGRAEQPASKAPPAKQGTGTSGQSSPQTPQNMNPNTGTGSSMPQQHTR